MKSQLCGGQARPPAGWPWMRPAGQVLEGRPHVFARFSCWRGDFESLGIPVLVGGTAVMVTCIPCSYFRSPEDSFWS